MKILIISYFFPPLNRIASSRPYSWAKYWSRMGHEVMVLTKQKTEEDGPLNMEYHPRDLENVKILALKCWPFRLKKPDPGSMKHKIFRLPFVKSLYGYFKLLRNLLMKDFWGFATVKKLIELYEKYPYDIVVSTYGPPGSHFVASYIKKKINVFWVADYRDLWHGNHYRPKKWPLSCLEDKLERFIVHRADLMTTVSEDMNRKLSKRFNCDVITIENGFDEDDLVLSSNKEIFPNDNKFRICYTGTIYQGYQDPTPLFKALALLKDSNVYWENKIEVIFFGSRLGNLTKISSQYGLDNIVKTPGFISRKESLQVQRSADALLFLEWEDSSTNGILTGKLFEYLYSGKPILSIGGSTNSESAKIIQECGAGIVLGKSPQLIADTIQDLASGKITGRDNCIQEKIKRYSRKNLAQAMIAAIEERM